MSMNLDRIDLFIALVTIHVYNFDTKYGTPYIVT